MEIVICTEDGIAVSGKGVDLEVLGLIKNEASRLKPWLDKDTEAEELLRAAENVQRQLLMAAACACAKTVEHLVKEGEKRPRVAIETAKAWVRGEVTLQEVNAAAENAADAARAYNGHAAWAAAYAAWAAAYAASYDARAADAVDAVSVAATYDDAYAARHTDQSLIAIVRSIIKLPDVLWGELIC